MVLLLWDFYWLGPEGHAEPTHHQPSKAITTYRYIDSLPLLPLSDFSPIDINIHYKKPC